MAEKGEENCIQLSQVIPWKSDSPIKNRTRLKDRQVPVKIRYSFLMAVLYFKASVAHTQNIKR